MRLNEILVAEEQLDEFNFRHAAAAGMLTLAALTGSDAKKEEPAPVAKTEIVKKSRTELEKEQIIRLANAILDKYNVDDKLAVQVAALAKKYEKRSFPKAEDILAVIGIESSFKPHAVSQLKHDKAIGLMQVRPGVWGLSKSALNGVENQVKIGADILHRYYEKLGDGDKALHAYNVGITNFMKNKNLNPRYAPKVRAERERYEDDV